MSDVMVYVPGRGNVNSKAYRVDRALREYDERLSFQFHPETRQWCAFMQMPRGHEPPEIPVYGFDPPERIPEVHEALQKIEEMDTLRHGQAIWNRIVRDSEAIRAAREAQAAEGTEALAEAVEFHRRKSGETKYTKVHMAVPKTRKKKR